MRSFPRRGARPCPGCVCAWLARPRMTTRHAVPASTTAGAARTASCAEPVPATARLRVGLQPRIDAYLAGQHLVDRAHVRDLQQALALLVGQVALQGDRSADVVAGGGRAFGIE